MLMQSLSRASICISCGLEREGMRQTMCRQLSSCRFQKQPDRDRPLRVGNAPQCGHPGGFLKVVTSTNVM